MDAHFNGRPLTSAMPFRLLAHRHRTRSLLRDVDPEAGSVHGHAPSPIRTTSALMTAASERPSCTVPLDRGGRGVAGDGPTTAGVGLRHLTSEHCATNHLAALKR